MSSQRRQNVNVKNVSVQTKPLPPKDSQIQLTEPVLIFLSRYKVEIAVLALGFQNKNPIF